MTKDELLKKTKERFGDRIRNIFEKSYKRIYIDIDPKDLTDFVKFIFNESEARFNTASCVDMLDSMEILYHFSFAKASLVVNLRASLDKKSLVIESLTSIMKGAEWIEREIHELFGVEFKNHPNMRKLLLPDDWPEGLYPLRRDYKEEDYEIRKAEKEEGKS